MYLLERGIRLTGTDGWSLGCALHPYRRNYETAPMRALSGRAHKAGREIGYCHLEKLHNLEALPGDGFHVLLPRKDTRRFCRWTRAVAVVDLMRSDLTTSALPTPLHVDRAAKVEWPC